jgi:hypothetical protein
VISVITYMLLLISVYRVSRLEMLDEVEELDLVLGHYAVSWGLLNFETKWGDWGLKLSRSCRQHDEHEY